MKDRPWLDFGRAGPFGFMYLPRDDLDAAKLVRAYGQPVRLTYYSAHRIRIPRPLAEAVHEAVCPEGG